jgi:hypothetical protein
MRDDTDPDGTVFVISRMRVEDNQVRWFLCSSGREDKDLYTARCDPGWCKYGPIYRHSTHSIAFHFDPSLISCYLL